MSMTSLFQHDIHDWASWGGVFQSIDAWQPLIRYIYKKERLEFSEIENLTPGTNAVFKVGKTVIKIFAPTESGFDCTEDIQTETFAIRHAKVLGVSVPECISLGCIEDKYTFSYMIMEWIDGREFTEIAALMPRDDKIHFGRKLRDITDRMNTPCSSFNGIDVIHDRGRYRRWDSYPEAFRSERIPYIKSYDYGEKIFVHGDLCSDNILVAGDGTLYIIDFADAVTAPVQYEQALVASELFRFDPAFLKGYFGRYDVDWLTDLCFHGLLIHDYGGDILKQYAAKPEEITSLEKMRERLYLRIKEEKNYEESDSD